MSIVQPTDGHAIYEDINPNEGQSTWGPRLDQIAAGGFKVVVNYGLCYGSTANMIAYINYAFSKGLKIAIALERVCAPLGGSLATTYPTMYVEAGSPGTTAFNAFGVYVVNQVKNLAGTWGYYIADEPQDTNHTTLKSFHDAIVAADNTKPILIICNSDTTTSGISNFWYVHTVNWTDCCTVGGDDFYPIGLTPGSITGFTIGSVADATQSWCNTNSINSAIVLQGFDFGHGDPSIADMQAMLEQTLTHMQPQLLLWFGYYYIFGSPSGAYSPQAADPNASTMWADLCRAIGSVPSRYQQEVLTDAPVLYTRLDDPLCFAYGDDVVSTHALTIGGAVVRQQSSLLVSDLNPSCSFNGTSASITLNTANLPTGSHAFSMECWVKAATWPGAGNYPGFMTFGTAGVGGQSASLGFDGDANRLIFIFKSLDEIPSLAAPVNGSIYHVVGTYDGTQARFYVNGVLQQVARNETLNITLTSAYIGRDIDGNNFAGIIDEVAYYNTALSPARILAHYNAGQAIGPSVPPLGNGRLARIG
jgi:hypothetical protein